MNDDFLDMLSALLDENADFLVVGAYALAHHGLPRATGDIDIWVRRTSQNAERVWRALDRFGAPLDMLSQDDLEAPDLVFQIGVAPSRIDLLTSIDGVEFDEAWESRAVSEIEDLEIPVLSREHLLLNKRSTARPQDLADVAWLERRGA